MDSNFGVPAPPMHAYYDPQNTIYAECILIIVGLIVVGFATRDSIRFKTVLPVTVALSGVFCVFPEVFIDVLGGCLWPTSPGHVAFKILGREMTWFPVTAWFAFGALLTYICFGMMLREVKTKWIWVAFAVAGCMDIVFEEIMLNVRGLYVYYGHQPLVLLTKFPWWWLPINTAGLFLAAALAYRYRQHLHGWKAAIMFPLTPFAYMAVHGFAGMPADAVINGDYSWIITQAGGIATSLLCLVATALMIHLVLERNPFRLNATNIGIGTSSKTAADKAAPLCAAVEFDEGSGLFSAKAEKVEDSEGNMTINRNAAKPRDQIKTEVEPTSVGDAVR